MVQKVNCSLAQLWLTSPHWFTVSKQVQFLVWSGSMVLSQCYSNLLTLSDPWVGLWKAEHHPKLLQEPVIYAYIPEFLRKEKLCEDREKLRCRQNCKLSQKSSIYLPFLRSLSGGRLCVGCRDSSSISWVIASLWGLGNSRLNTPQSPSAPSGPWEACGSILPQSRGWNWAGSQESFGSINCPFRWVSLLPAWIQERRTLKTELAGNSDPPQDILYCVHDVANLEQHSWARWYGYFISLLKCLAWHFLPAIWKSSVAAQIIH